MLGRPVLAASIIAATLVLPAQALGGTVTISGSTATYTGMATSGPGESVDLVEENGLMGVTSTLGVTSPDCMPGTDSTRVDCPLTPAFAIVFGGLDDAASGEKVTGATTLEVRGGAGGDRLTGTPNADRLYGEDGSDNLEGLGGNDVLDGGPGENYLGDGAGDDVVTGGAHNDTWYAGPGRDAFSGGPGTDRADYSLRTAALTITANGQPVSGEPGEGDSVGADVEDLIGGSGPDQITGGANGGTLRGGAGNDTIKGTAQSDRIEGDEGDDVIDSRDGVYDSIDCGPGNDTVLADQGDAYTNCEASPDRDGDGTLNEADCAPDNPAVHPGAGEVYGNAIDEDCSGEPNYLQVSTGVTYDLKVKKGPARVRFRAFRVKPVQSGDRVAIRCKGKGCAFSSRSRTAGSGQTSLNLVRLFKQRYLRKGATITVAISRANQIGRTYTLTVTRKATIKLKRRCVPVGSTTPGTCPAA